MTKTPMQRPMLPNEVLEMIFLELDYNSLEVCQQVSKLFKDVILTSKQIQYIYELQSAKLIDQAPPGMEYHKRLTWVRDWKESWDKLDWAIFPEETIAGGSHAYDLTGGVFGALVEDNFVALSLPSKTRGSEQVSRALDFHARDFAMDQTQDLVIFFERQATVGPSAKLYIRSYGSLKPHPEAREPEIMVEVHGYISMVYLQICHSRVLVSVPFGKQTQFCIYDWKSSDLLFDQIFVRTEVEAVSFVDPDTFMVANQSDSGYISVFRLTSGREELRLCFPTVRLGCKVVKAVVDTSPFLASRLEGRIFSASEENRIYVVSLDYEVDDAVADLALQFFIHGRVFRGPFSGTDSPTVLPWDDWGRHNARVRNGESFDWHCFCDVYRAVLPMSKHIKVLDFNGNDGSKPSVLFNPTFFKGPFVSGLPYKMISRKTPKRIRARMISLLLDDERIVVVYEPPTEGGYQITTMAL